MRGSGQRDGQGKGQVRGRAMKRPAGAPSATTRERTRLGHENLLPAPAAIAKAATAARAEAAWYTRNFFIEIPLMVCLWGLLQTLLRYRRDRDVT